MMNKACTVDANTSHIKQWIYTVIIMKQFILLIYTTKEWKFIKILTLSFTI